MLSKTKLFLLLWSRFTTITTIHLKLTLIGSACAHYWYFIVLRGDWAFIPDPHDFHQLFPTMVWLRSVSMRIPWIYVSETMQSLSQAVRQWVIHTQWHQSKSVGYLQIFSYPRWYDPISMLAADKGPICSRRIISSCLQNSSSFCRDKQCGRIHITSHISLRGSLLSAEKKFSTQFCKLLSLVS